MTATRTAPSTSPPSVEIPFDDDTETEIDDKPVDDYVGEGEDRPGEGIHF